VEVPSRGDRKFSNRLVCCKTLQPSPSPFDTGFAPCTHRLVEPEGLRDRAGFCHSFTDILAEAA